MTHTVYKKIIYGLLFTGLLFVSGESAHAQTRYREEYSSRSRVSSSTRSEIRRLERQEAVEDLPIPILFGITVNNLQDTWGDARSGGRTHEGIDILAPRGELIVSPTDAVVTTIDTGGNGGKHVYTTNPGGERYYFAHLDDFAENLEEGDILEAGDLIGYVGNTGNASGGPTHLHFGLYDEDHDATNPFPRITREFTLKERMEAFGRILDDSDDETELARKIVNQYNAVFVEARAQGIELPEEVMSIMTAQRTDILGISRILQVGIEGDDVKLLQTTLGLAADGSFGPKTKAAVAAFQVKAGLPADGVFGATTRIALANSSILSATLPAGCTATTAYSPTTGVKCQ